MTDGPPPNNPATASEGNEQHAPGTNMPNCSGRQQVGVQYPGQNPAGSQYPGQNPAGSQYPGQNPAGAAHFPSPPNMAVQFPAPGTNMPNLSGSQQQAGLQYPGPGPQLLTSAQPNPAGSHFPGGSQTQYHAHAGFQHYLPMPYQQSTINQPGPSQGAVYGHPYMTASVPWMSTMPGASKSPWNEEGAAAKDGKIIKCSTCKGRKEPVLLSTLASKSCCECGNNQGTLVLDPCGHGLFCEPCVIRIKFSTSVCPACNKIIYKWIALSIPEK